MSSAASSYSSSLPPSSRGDRPLVKSARAHIARIVSVTGAQAVAIVDSEVSEAHRRGEERIEIGALMKIASQRTIVMGVVSAVSIPVPDAEDGKQPIGLVELNLAGEISVDKLTLKPMFRRGVTSIPTIGDPVQMADHSDLALVYTPTDADTITVGTLFQDPSVPARLLTNELFGKHFTVVGTTGCGKSSALTCILQSVLQDHKHAHIVLLDIHNEYAGAFGDRAELIDPSNLRLPFWLLNFQELTAALTSNDAHHDAECEILADTVLQAKRRYADAASGRLRKAADSSGLTVDTPTPFRLSDVVGIIDDQLGRLERTQATLPYKRLKSRIDSLVSDPRYGFMFGSLVIEDTMTETLGRIFRVPIQSKPITVLNLAAVPVEILDVVISLVSRLAFDLAVWSDGGVPILLVCEEAHRYAPVESNGIFQPTKLALARIAKEGRKYGVSLALITQRPSELDPTILSQCSTAIAMRLSTDRDQAVMRANTHEGALDLLDFLPLLGDREAIVLGQGTPMPVRIKFNSVAEVAVPKTRHTGFAEAWRNPHMRSEELEEVVRRWRLSVRSKTWA
jgi:DNA helicase HerA-like ATPase